ncbi:hypothetical protein BDP27DRAFT_1369226 [Rhodocollybia butyracea]|uniref:Uncharacterized protein n=1 Tax=Rhodocollybia butyracea TaxID=206335 RepID=A0A9P5PDM9_9AGAR|nr:hypothetical protein BDP27DRAFT_1369226 [Rhodocollybia butyracea]
MYGNTFSQGFECKLEYLLAYLSQAFKHPHRFDLCDGFLIRPGHLFLCSTRVEIPAVEPVKQKLEEPTSTNQDADMISDPDIVSSIRFLATSTPERIMKRIMYRGFVPSSKVCTNIMWTEEILIPVRGKIKQKLASFHFKTRRSQFQEYTYLS